MYEALSVNQSSHALIPYRPPLSVQTFMKREVEKATSKCLTHLVEVALATSKQLSIDVLPNRSIQDSIGVMTKLGLRHGQRFEIAKCLVIESDPSVVMTAITLISGLRFNENQRFALTKIFLSVYPWANLSLLPYFGLTLDHAFDIAARMTIKNPFLTTFFMRDYGRWFSQEQRDVLGTLCAERAPKETTQYIRDFYITQAQRFEIAKICAKERKLGSLTNWLKPFELSPEQKLEIQKLYFTIDYESVQQCIGSTTKQVMVYGFTHSKYEQVMAALKDPGSPVQKVFDWVFGDPEKEKYNKTLEGTPIEAFPIDAIPSDEKRTIARACKAAITNLVLENFKRSQKGLPLIPLLFCVESPTTVAHHKLTVQSLTSKESKTNKIITHKELRRVYKLCKELERDSDPIARALALLAQNTVKMVRIERAKSCGETFVMKSVVPVWEHAEWKEAWAMREEQKSPEMRQKEQLTKPHYWKGQLLRRAKCVADSQ